MKYLNLIPLAALLMIGCGDAGQSSDNPEAETALTEPAQTARGEALGLTFNNGEKWVVNQITDETMRKIMNMLGNFEGGNMKKAPDFAKMLTLEISIIQQRSDKEAASYEALSKLMIAMEEHIIAAH
jgi:hypothetical protein